MKIFGKRWPSRRLWLTTRSCPFPTPDEAAARSGPPAFHSPPSRCRRGRVRPRREKGLATATDAKIIDFARQGGWIVVTLDADFHILLALSGATSPSVVRIRIEGQRAEGLATLLV